VMREADIMDGFIGHLELPDFLLVVPSASATGLSERIRSRLDQSLEYFYPIRDRENIASNLKRLSVKIGAMPAQSAPTDLAALKADLLARKA
jgi:hypothetical protein